MHRISSRLKLSVALIGLALNCVVAVSAARAQSIDLSLNVLYDTPATPETSAGDWQLVAKSSSPGTFGIFSLDVYLKDIVAPIGVAVGPRGTVNTSDPAGFSALTVFNLGSGIYELIIGQTPIGPLGLGPGEEEAVFYGVGTIANGEPGDIGPVFTSLSNTAAIPWATGDVLGDPAWSTGVLLASGTFLAGSEPMFYTQGVASRGRVFTSVGTSTAIGATTPQATPIVASTVVRDNLMLGTGDYNHDHVVNAADYTVWRNTLGQVGTGLDADGNLNGMIDEGDYNIWKANFGNVVPGAGGGAGSLGSTAAVPEPNLAALIVGVLGGAFCGRKRGFLTGFCLFEKSVNQSGNCLTRLKRRSIMLGDTSRNAAHGASIGRAC